MTEPPAPELHRVTGRARKCGPSALSAIFQVPTHEAARVIREQVRFNALPVNGVDPDDLAAAATYLAAQADPLAIVGSHDYADRPTLKRFLEALRPGVPVACCTRTHWIAALKQDDGAVLVADSGAWFARKPELWKGAAGRRKVTHAVTVDWTRPAAADPADPPAAEPKCEACKAPLPRAATGRPKRYCNTACRMVAYRKRKTL